VPQVVPAPWGIAPWGFSQLLNFVNLFMRRSLVGLSKRLRRCDTWEYGMILGCVGIMRGEGGGIPDDPLLCLGQGWVALALHLALECLPLSEDYF